MGGLGIWLSVPNPGNAVSATQHGNVSLTI
jgi:hypothetical protein